MKWNTLKVSISDFSLLPFYSGELDEKIGTTYICCGKQPISLA